MKTTYRVEKYTTGDNEKEPFIIASSTTLRDAQVIVTDKARLVRKIYGASQYDRIDRNCIHIETHFGRIIIRVVAN